MEPRSEASLAARVCGPGRTPANPLGSLSDTREYLGHLCHTLDELRAYVTTLYNNRVLGNTPENVRTDYLERLSLRRSLRQLHGEFDEELDGPYVVEGERLLEIEKIVGVDVQRQCFEVKWRNSQVPFDQVVGLPDYVQLLTRECVRIRDADRRKGSAGSGPSPASEVSGSSSGLKTPLELS